MATLNLANPYIEYLFSEEEYYAACILQPPVMQMLQTLRSAWYQQKASSLGPEDASEDRSYFTKLAELEGKIGAVTEIFDNHKKALAWFASPDRKNPDAKPVDTGTVMDDLATRAANLVDKTGD